jgi:hypothetical protein
MKKLILAVMIVFALIGGTTTFVSIGTQPAYAEPGGCGNSGC